MAARVLPGSDCRVRRGRRHDLGAVRTLLGAGDLPPKFFRRLISDLGSDVYVAEDPDGAIVGLVSVAYARSLVRGGASALLDGVRTAREPAGPLLEGLIAFAEDRARRRGCRRLAAWVEPEDGVLRAALLKRGYQVGELLVTDLGAAR
jgi:GNAT superfamily N-acetyltransferase